MLVSSLASKPDTPWFSAVIVGRTIGRARSSPHTPVSLLTGKLHRSSLRPRNSMVPSFLNSTGNCGRPRAQDTDHRGKEDSRAPSLEGQKEFLNGEGGARDICTAELAAEDSTEAQRGQGQTNRPSLQQLGPSAYLTCHR